MKRKKSKNTKKTGIIISVFAVAVIIIILAVLFKNDFSFGDKAAVNDESQVQKDTTETEKGLKSEDPQQDNHDDKTSEQGETNEGSASYIEGQEDPTEPTYINGILIANKKYAMPSTYNKGVDPEAQAALDKMVAAGKEAGFTYEAFSGFRSYEYQTSLYNRYVAKDGKEAADRYSARPGHSEHQTGLAFDIGESNNQDLWLTEEFGQTPAGQWLMENAYLYGFILRYPKGKEDITGFMYESWHYRYVGTEHAKAIKEADITLEEYLNIN